MERETEIEKMVRRKLEIEKMREQQSLMDDLLRKKHAEIGVLGEELEKKDYDSANLLSKALKRAEILSKQIENGAIDEQT